MRSPAQRAPSALQAGFVVWGGIDGPVRLEKMLINGHAGHPQLAFRVSRLSEGSSLKRLERLGLPGHPCPGREAHSVSLKGRGSLGGGDPAASLVCALGGSGSSAQFGQRFEVTKTCRSIRAGRPL